MYKLYIKTHNITGLKYLGITQSKDPHKYRGSGIDWKEHCQLYGYDYNTEIIGYYETKNELREAGVYYSKLWNVVDSEEWANRIPENVGGCGSFNHLTKEEIIENSRKGGLAGGYKGGIKCRDNKIGFHRITKQERSEIGRKSGLKQKALKLGFHGLSKEKRIDSARKAGSKSKGKIWITNGINNRRILPFQEIPIGWKQGRAKFSRS